MLEQINQQVNVKVLNSFGEYVTYEITDVRHLCDRMDKFFERVADDLETYAAHAKRNTIEVEDVVLLLKRSVCCGIKSATQVL